MTTPSPRKHSKRRTIPTLITNDPPLVLSDEQLAAYRATGKRILQLQFPMLESINRKYGTTRTGAHTFYTNTAYKRQEERVRASIIKQVQAAHWTTTKDDFYILVFDFAFPHLVKQDSDGPRKATADCLQQEKLTKKEKQLLVTQAMLDAWKALRPPAIHNDGQIMQELVIKHVNQTDLTCQVTIYAFDRKNYIPVPMHSLLHTYLLSHN